MRFVMLVPKSLDPAARGRQLPLPDARPSDQIAKLFPQTAPAPAPAKDQKTASSASTPTVGQAAATVVPLPVERPKSAPAAEMHHSREPRHIPHP
jgi:membrane-bound lytic murein transglycosylase A